MNLSILHNMSLLYKVDKIMLLVQVGLNLHKLYQICIISKVTKMKKALFYGLSTYSWCPLPESN